MDTSKQLITRDQIRLIFSEVEVILAYNKRLLEDLEPRVKEWGPNQRLGDIFLQIVRDFVSDLLLIIICYSFSLSLSF